MTKLIEMTSRKYLARLVREINKRMANGPVYCDCTRIIHVRLCGDNKISGRTMAGKIVEVIPELLNDGRNQIVASREGRAS